MDKVVEPQDEARTGAVRGGLPAASGRGDALCVRGLRKSYGKLEALRDVTFRMAAGERLALLGPNGAGKTTLIRCIAGRTKPNEGGIELFGAALPPTGGRERLGWVPQDIAVYADLTTRENLTAFGRFHGLSGRELARRVDWALAWTGLEDRAGDLVGGFSGGMKRRVNLACGVMHGPDVLLLDEPTVGVDPQSRQRIFEMLDQLHQAGTSILLTTHHLDEAEQRCDRIVIIDHGKVIAEGSLDELIRGTIGSSRHVQLRLDRPLERELPPWVVGSHRGTLGGPLGGSLGTPVGGTPVGGTPVGGTLVGGTLGGSTKGSTGSSMAETRGADRYCLMTRVDDVAGQLPGLLESVRVAGYGVLNVDVHAPSLHDVFLHLTGQELRD